jgi:hypothetical protein
MTFENFKNWLEGFLAAKNGGSISPTEVELINKQLNQVQESSPNIIERYYVYPNYYHPPYYYTSPWVPSTTRGTTSGDYFPNNNIGISYTSYSVQ